MVDKGRGYEPERGFMEAFLRKLSMFHDAEAYDPVSCVAELKNYTYHHENHLTYVYFEQSPTSMTFKFQDQIVLRHFISSLSFVQGFKTEPCNLDNSTITKYHCGQY